MFPLHHGDELCFQSFSMSNQQDKITGPYGSPKGSNFASNIESGQRRKLVDHDESTHNDSHKKMIHRDIERQRRQEMATLYASLRSQLPIEYIKGKRSISDHMNEAVNYIKHLQKKIKELGVKRDDLKRLSKSSQSESSNKRKLNHLKVHQCCGGVEVVIGSSHSENQFSLSRVLKLLLEEGHNIISCVSSIKDESLVHTIQSEVNDPANVDLLELQSRLSAAIFG